MIVAPQRLPADDESDTSALPLSGVRVLDLGRELTAHCSRLFAQLGATVTKVEAPKGSPIRTLPEDNGRLFSYLHAGMRGVTLNIGDRQATVVLEALASREDIILIEPSLRHPISGWNPDLQCLAWAPESAIVAAVTSFGLTGPWRDFRATHLVSYALSGLMYNRGPSEGPPLEIPGRAKYGEVGVHAAAAAMAALMQRPYVGGQLIDISAHEVLSSQDNLVERYHVDREFPDRTPAPAVPPNGRWNCSDGVVRVIGPNPHHWSAFVELLGFPPQLCADEFASREVRHAQCTEIGAIAAEILASRTVAEVVAEGQRLRLPIAPINSPAQFLNDAQTVARSFLQEYIDANGAPFVAPGSPFKSSPRLVGIDLEKAPALGEHNVDVYVEELGFSDTQLLEWASNGLV